MNCITSATETSLRLPEIPISGLDTDAGCQGGGRGLLAPRQLDQALQSAELAVLGGEEPRGKHRGGGMRGQEVEEVAVLGPQNRLVVEQLVEDQGAHDVVLDAQGDRGER